MAKTGTSGRVTYLVKLAMLIAIIIILSATPYGYIRIGPIVATIIQIPVLVGAVLLGPLAGVILGAAFAVTSFMQAVTGTEPVGTFILSANPPAAIFICFVPRILMGFLAAWLYKLIKVWDKKNYFASTVTGFVGSLLNTVLYLGGLVVFVRELVAQAMGISEELVAVVAVGIGVSYGIPEAVASLLIVTAVAKAMDAYNNSRLTQSF